MGPGTAWDDTEVDKCSGRDEGRGTCVALRGMYANVRRGVTFERLFRFQTDNAGNGPSSRGLSWWRGGYVTYVENMVRSEKNSGFVEMGREGN